MTVLLGRRVLLRPLQPGDFTAWREVRLRNRVRLTRWEPRAVSQAAESVTNAAVFAERCRAHRKERERGDGYGFGVFVDKRFRGEMNLSSIQRGPFQSCYVGYWIDEAAAGNGYAPEALVVAARYGFEWLRLHRLQVSIVPRNSASLRVVEKLGLRCEGLAERYVEIDGVWEDHYRFAITAEEWLLRADELTKAWIAPDSLKRSRDSHVPFVSAPADRLRRIGRRAGRGTATGVPPGEL